MNTIDCGHKNNCSSYPTKCDSCRKNPNKKKDFYEPDGWYPTHPLPPIRFPETPTPIWRQRFDYWC